MGDILVADDDTTCRDSIQKVLERAGHSVRTAGDVDGALNELPLETLISSSATTGCGGRPELIF
jgi:DNA-binding NtrC family response regulator